MSRQNCLYTTQGSIICQNEEKAIPVLHGFPKESETVFESFQELDKMKNEETLETFTNANVSPFIDQRTSGRFW
jgi:hypothetical protein